MFVWILFIALIIVLLAIDLGVFNKEAAVVSAKQAGVFTSIWFSIAVLFSGVVYLLYSYGIFGEESGLSPTEAMITYFTGYLVEVSLSMDNIFVMSMIFSYFNIPKKYQHRVLFWGILGAIVFRAIMILLGVTLIEKFEWTIYILGFVLLYSAYKMAFSDEGSMDFDNNRMVRAIKKIFPVTKTLEGQKFFVKRDGVRAVTPLFIVLIIIEISDIVFAVDSIPAILGITTDGFLVFSSNIFAILGLRSMYFLLDSLMSKFLYLNYSLIFILSFVGLKMILSNVIHLPIWVSLGVIVCALGIGLLVSLTKKTTS